jgi:hypothetical protein
VRRRRNAPATLAAAVLSLALASAAEPLESGPFRLAWTAPASCPGATDVLARIESLLGAKVPEVLQLPLAARGHVQARTNPERFELSLETFQQEQRFTREMQAPSCAELTGAAALVLALAIDPRLSERLGGANAAPPAPAPESAPSADPSADPSAPASSAQPGTSTTAPALRPSDSAATPAPELAVPPSSGSRLAFFGGVALVADAGSIAPFALGPAATLGLAHPAFELALDATWLPHQRSFAESDPDKGGDITLLAFTLRPCGVLRAGPVQGGLCAALDLGDIWGTGFGTATRTTRHALWLAAGGSLFGRYRLAPALALSLRGSLGAPLQDIEFSLENVGLVYAVPGAVARLALAAEVHFD